jgi:hypothetical protein
MKRWTDLVKLKAEEDAKEKLEKEIEKIASEAKSVTIGKSHSQERTDYRGSGTGHRYDRDEKSRNGGNQRLANSRPLQDRGHWSLGNDDCFSFDKMDIVNVDDVSPDRRKARPYTTVSVQITDVEVGPNIDILPCGISVVNSNDILHYICNIMCLMFPNVSGGYTPRTRLFGGLDISRMNPGSIMSGYIDMDSDTFHAFMDEACKVVDVVNSRKCLYIPMLVPYDSGFINIGEMGLNGFCTDNGNVLNYKRLENDSARIFVFYNMATSYPTVHDLKRVDGTNFYKFGDRQNSGDKQKSVQLSLIDVINKLRKDRSDVFNSLIPLFRLDQFIWRPMVHKCQVAFCSDSYHTLTDYAKKKGLVPLKKNTLSSCGEMRPM